MSQKYCTSCGSPIPDGQGKSCSMCYGDPSHGRDGYYQDMLDEQYRQEQKRQYEAQQEEQQQEDQ